MLEIIIPTFVNAHLFWIIPKKDLFLRKAMSKSILIKFRTKSSQKLLKHEEISDEQVVAVNIDSSWVRGIIKLAISSYEEDTKYVCWLPDYGITRIVNSVYRLPDGMEKCPHLAKQASLHNVVNLMTDLVLENGAYELKLKKTFVDIDGVRRVFIDYIEEAGKIFFKETASDEYTTYGDVVCANGNDEQQSLTDGLIEKKLLTHDADMFNRIERSRGTLKDNYFKNSPNWHNPTDTTEIDSLEYILFAKEKNELADMEFFTRK